MAEEEHSSQARRLLKIGEFARLGHVTAAMLRNYDDLGLLHPAHVDPATDYRFYTLDQLARLNRILALKELGIPLQNVRIALDSDVSSDEIRALLAEREDALRKSIAAEQDRLRRLQNRRLRLKADGALNPLEVVIKPIPALLAASYRQIIETGYDIEPLFIALYTALAAHNVTTKTPIGLFYLDAPLNNSDSPLAFWLEDGRPVTLADLPGNHRQDIEACFVIERPLHEPIPFRDGLITSRLIPSDSQVASIVFNGDITHRGAAGTVFQAWVAANDYRVRSPIREVYHRTDDHNAQLQNIIDLQFPISLPINSSSRT